MSDKEEKEIHANFADVPQTTKVTATVSDKCVVKMKKALNSWVESMNRKCAVAGGNALLRKARSACADFSEGVCNRKYYGAHGVAAVCGFGHPLGVFQCAPLDEGGLQYSGISHPMGSIVFVNYI